MKIDLTGKTALVTGATGELGKVISLTLAQCGADVGIQTYSQPEEAEKLKVKIQELGQQASWVQANITTEEGVAKIKTMMENDLRMPDIIVNNAVIQYSPWTSVLEQPLKDYKSQFESNVLQNVLMAKAFVPAMIEKKHGRIVIVNTECAMQCKVGQSAYVSGKRGLDGLARVLAKEVGEEGITVNQVAPGWIASKNRPDNDEPGTEAYKSEVPLKRRGTEQDIANAVGFLASDLAGFITGLYVPVAGGNVMPTI